MDHPSVVLERPLHARHRVAATEADGRAEGPRLDGNDDNRYLSPSMGLPGYRFTVGMARHWHFLSVLFWVGNGLVFAALLFGTGQWRRLVPPSW